MKFSKDFIFHERSSLFFAKLDTFFPRIKNFEFTMKSANLAYLEDFHILHTYIAISQYIYNRFVGHTVRK